ncbi:5'-hydroxyaverantin dehydrogenase [Lachnellula suecica]|uniref:5'-hydroxyaverantin dehydrogenase n=1 Tax=Lachnellula suecica TaxID=602035 RepID=A0A8T9BXV5_9HELO|nr:5'-hydroxyaverantin dehydrogenase [Lachnellula suecica]
MSKSGAIITGGASGVGLELTKHLLSKGWRVVMLDINKAGEEISKELGLDVLWVETDVSKWESQVKAYETGISFDPSLILRTADTSQAFSWCPELSFLAANAGLYTDATDPSSIMFSQHDGLPEKPPLENFGVNLIGTIYSIKLFLHHIQKLDPSQPKDGSPKARIVITSSQAGIYRLCANPIYTSSKQYLVGLTRSLGPYYSSTYSITINSIAPGAMPTPLIGPVIPLTPTKYMTPFTTIMKVFDRFIDGKETGQIIEASGENSYVSKQQEFADETSRWVFEDAAAFWGDALNKIGKKAEVGSKQEAIRSKL